MVVALYCPLVPCSVEYPMPCAYCLECHGVWLCSDCPVAQVVLLSLSSCILLKGALLVQGFGLLQPLLSSAFL